MGRFHGYARTVLWVVLAVSAHSLVLLRLISGDHDLVLFLAALGVGATTILVLDRTRVILEGSDAKPGEH